MNHPIESSVTLAEKAALYRRVSTDQQDDSLELQEKKVIAYAQFKGLPVSEGLIFSDPDTSGSIPILDRTGGRALVNRLRLGDIKHLVVAKLDRLGRNTRDGLTLLEFLRENNITLHIVDLGGESISTQGHIGQLILTLMFAFAQWELGEIRDRTKKAMQNKFEQGELTGNVPYGWDAEYKFTDGRVHLSSTALSAAELTRLGHGDPVSKRLVDNLAEQDIIRTLAAWRRLPDGNKTQTSYNKIAALANARGYTAKNGQPWGCGNVFSVLTNQHTQRLLRSGDGSSPLQTPAPE